MDVMDVRRLHGQALRETKAIREQSKDAERSPDLTEEARNRILWKLKEEHSTFFDKHIAPARRGLAEVEAEFARCQPEALEAAAAARDPGKAVEARNLAQGAPYPDLKVYGEDAVHRRSPGRAHGLRQAIVRNDDLTDEEKGGLLSDLDSISKAQTTQARAGLVGYRLALSQLEAASRSIAAHPVLADPKKAISDFRAAGLLPIGPGGESIQLREEEIQRLLKLAGVPPHPPIPDQ